jgi:hypothetical protein
MNSLMQRIRNAITSDTFNSFRDNFIAGYNATDEKVRLAQKKKWLDAQKRKDINRG